MCNRTQLIVTRLHQDCIEGRVLGGKHDGQQRLISQIKLINKEGDYPWILMRKQFPICLCFAMTVIKSKEQSLSVVGIDLISSYFSYG